MYDNIASLKFVKNTSGQLVVTTLVSAEREEMELLKQVMTDSRVEEWMNVVLHEMRLANRKITKTALFYYCDNMTRLDWMMHYQVQYTQDWMMHYQVQYTQDWMMHYQVQYTQDWMMHYQVQYTQDSLGSTHALLLGRALVFFMALSNHCFDAHLSLCVSVHQMQSLAHSYSQWYYLPVPNSMGHLHLQTY